MIRPRAPHGDTTCCSSNSDEAGAWCLSWGSTRRASEGRHPQGNATSTRASPDPRASPKTRARDNVVIYRTLCSSGSAPILSMS
ncbi:hypothetical protein ACFFX0_24360 [Citricoccus parietis]